MALPILSHVTGALSPFKKGTIWIVITLAFFLAVWLPPYNEYWLKIAIGLIDIYWLGALVAAACYSAEVADADGWFPLPNRFAGLCMFIAFSILQVRVFGQLYHAMPSDFKAGDCDYLKSQTDAYYLSFGTMSTVDIVDYAPITAAAKQLKTYQVISNLIQFFTIFPLLLSRFSTFKDAKRPQPKRKIIYDSQFEGAPFSAVTLKELTGYDGEEWYEMVDISISGGKKLVEKKDVVIDGKYPKLKLSVDNINLDFLIKFDFQTTNKVEIEKFFLNSSQAKHEDKISERVARHIYKKGFKNSPVIAPDDTREKEPKISIQNSIQEAFKNL